MTSRVCLVAPLLAVLATACSRDAGPRGAVARDPSGADPDLTPRGPFAGPGWKVFNPEWRFKFAYDEGSVTFEVPAGSYSVYPGPEQKYAPPSLLREADGDFEATVRVRGRIPASDEAYTAAA